MKLNRTLQLLKEMLMLTIGSAVYSAALALFMDPNKLAPGGISGLAVIISHLTNGVLSTGVLIFIMNIPLLALARVKLGRKMFYYTLYTLALVPLFMDICESLTNGMPIIQNDMFLNAVAGSCLMAFGIGIIFRNFGTTGGSDIIVKLLRLKYKHIKTGTFFFATDAVIVALSGICFSDLSLALYAGVSVLIQSVLIDLVLYGPDGAGLVYIISDKQSVISKRLLNELDCGVTILFGEGAYNGDEKQVMMAAMHKQVVPKAREIVREEDESSFMIITSATQVFGEGFRSHKSQDL